MLSLVKCLPQSCYRLLGANDLCRAGRSHTHKPALGLLEAVAGSVQLGIFSGHVVEQRFRSSTDRVWIGTLA